MGESSVCVCRAYSEIRDRTKSWGGFSDLGESCWLVANATHRGVHGVGYTQSGGTTLTNTIILDMVMVSGECHCYIVQ